MSYVVVTVVGALMLVWMPINFASRSVQPIQMKYPNKGRADLMRMLLCGDSRHTIKLIYNLSIFLVGALLLAFVPSPFSEYGLLGVMTLCIVYILIWHLQSERDVLRTLGSKKNTGSS